MYCPVCKAEYREGYTRCADCDVDLVLSLPQETEYGEHDAFVSVASAADVGQLGEICSKLEAKNIPYRKSPVADSGFSIVARKPLSSVAVPPAYFEAARAALEADSQEDSSGTNSEPSDRVRNEDDGEYFFPEEDGPDEARPPLDPDSWNPEDATSPVWSGLEGYWAEVVVASLQENGIHWRIDDGTNVDEPYSPEKSSAETHIQILVLPEDLARASQIVQEIVTKKPL